MKNRFFFNFKLSLWLVLFALVPQSALSRSPKTPTISEQMFHSFWWLYGFSPYQYEFADAMERNMQLIFISPNSVVLSNKPIQPGNYSFVDKYKVEQIDEKLMYRVVCLVSSNRLSPEGSSDLVLPFHGEHFEDSYDVFPILCNQDTIFMAKNFKHVQVGDFSFVHTTDQFNEYLIGGGKLTPIHSKKELKIILKKHRQLKYNGLACFIDSMLQYCDEKYLQ